jgi:hypothetical protein
MSRLVTICWLLDLGSLILAADLIISDLHSLVKVINH